MSLARNPVEISACILVKRSSLGEATLSVECGDIFHFLLFKFFSSREVAPLFLAVMGGGRNSRNSALLQGINQVEPG